VKTNQKEPADSGMGLSFLDVLSCGLGASILLLLIVKHEPSAIVSPELEQLAKTEVAILEKRIKELGRRIETKSSLLKKLKIKELEALEKNVLRSNANQNVTGELRRVQVDLIRANNKQLSLAQALDKTVIQINDEAIEPEVAEIQSTGALDGVELRDTDKVVIILDISASMVHWSLVEIFRLQAERVTDPMSLPKWKQAMLAAQYAYETINDGYRFKFFAFSENVFNMEGNVIDPKKTIRWDKKNELAGSTKLRDPRHHDKAFNNFTKNIGPKRGTDLSRVIGAVAQLVPKPNKILLITDGLPNRPSSTIVPNDGCAKRFLQSKKLKSVTIVSSKCRLSIALRSINDFSKKLSHVPVDVVLLPLEGDSGAVRFYTLLSSASGGRLTTPSYDWLVN
tara:strand:- start:198 stop:1385 length:1188 start_codon:yes stop_codon:yes gene_type:complete